MQKKNLRLSYITENPGEGTRELYLSKPRMYIYLLLLLFQAHELLTHRLQEWGTHSLAPHILPEASEAVIGSFKVIQVINHC